MFSAIGTVIVGLIVGVIAGFLLPGKEALPDGLTAFFLRSWSASRVLSRYFHGGALGAEPIMPPGGSCPCRCRDLLLLLGLCSVPMLNSLVEI